MFTTKSFIKKNKIGNFIKNVREHYLRDDIYCGFGNCNKCLSGLSNLNDSNKYKSNLYKYDHHLILDTNIILDQIDLLEEDVLENVIILHTVLQEVKHRSFPVYKRLMTIINNPTRKFYVFTNDHHKNTYVKQENSELINDYNDRCIRTACCWYINHLKQNKFILVTDDVANGKIAKELKIVVCKIKDYVNNLQCDLNVLDKLARKDFHDVVDADNLYPPHISMIDIHSGIKDGKYYQGTFHASKDNYLEGSIILEKFDEPVLLQGRSGLNRAVEGDTIAVEILPKSEWIGPSDIILEDESTEIGAQDVIEKEAQLLSITRPNVQNKKPTGRVVGVIKRKWRQYCGILQEGSSGLYHLFVPADRRIPKIRIETRQSEFLKTQKIIVAIDTWPRHSRYPSGHFIRALGNIGQQSTENEVALLEHDVPHSQFSEEVLSFLPKLPWIITEEDYKSRVDLRDYPICSVDPPGCTDIDDALHCKLLDGNKLEIGVHIADVSHFIRPGNALDVEASSRATTVYLVGNRIDMVPELLSSNLCSLRENVERFAFSCIWQIDSNGNVISTKFHKSIICSKKAMTYEEAQLLIDDKNSNDVLTESLRSLNKIAKILKRRRLDNGALVLASPEIKIMMDSETHDPIDVEVKKLFETNSMVEEFMLLANISVAEKILQEFPDCAVLRRHPSPPPANFNPLITAGKHLGFNINTDSGKALATSLDEAQRDDNPYLNTMLRILATRCMQQAVYFASGMLLKEDYFHYGLAVPLYTHFTSPIRRYADIMVHRLLAVAIGADTTYPKLLDKHVTENLSQNLNYRNRMSQYAARASVNFNINLFFKGKLEDEEGYILYVRKNALQILIPKYGLECTLYLAKKGEKSLFEYDEEEQTQKCGDVIFHAFDPVVVRLSLDSNNVQREKFALQLIKPYVPNFSVSSLNEQEDDVIGETRVKEEKEKRTETSKQDKSKSNKKGSKSKKSK